jgi:hypothetical protein
MTNKDTPPDISDFKGILGWLKEKKTSDEKKGTPWGWVTGLIAAAISFISIAIFTYKAWAKSRELAALKHRVDTMEEEKERNKVDKALQKEHFNQVKADEDIEQIQRVINVTEMEIDIARKAHQETITKIMAIKSWDEVDKL